LQLAQYWQAPLAESSSIVRSNLEAKWKCQVPSAFQREILLPRKFLGSESKILAINKKHPTTMTCWTQNTYRVDRWRRIGVFEFFVSRIPLQWKQSLRWFQLVFRFTSARLLAPSAIRAQSQILFSWSSRYTIRYGRKTTSRM
jgi:hypothetical protein